MVIEAQNFKLISISVDAPDSMHVDDWSSATDFYGLRLVPLALIGLCITLASAYRLAKFNISEEQSKEFFGLASPAAAIFIVGLFIIHTQGIEVQSMIGQKWLLILVSIIISALMVSNIPMFSFKLSGFSWQENKVQIVFVILSILLFLLFKIGALPLVIILYILINIARSFLSTP